MRRQLLQTACGLAVLTSACSGGTPKTGTPSATPTALATPTATVDPEFRWKSSPPSPCPLLAQTPCDVAVALNSAVRSGDVAKIMAFGEPLTVTCPTDLQQDCGSPGEIRRVFGPGKWGGGAGIVSPEALAEFLGEALSSSRRLPSGEVDVNVASIGCKAVSRCEEFAVVLALTHDDGDQMLQFAFGTDSSSGRPRFFGFVNTVPWEQTLRSGEPTPAAYLGAAGSLYAVPLVSFQAWTPR